MRQTDIITPVYNKSYALPHTLESIHTQKEYLCKLILVDDGSTDASADIDDEYALMNEECISVHKINGGVSESRNIGIKLTQGEYTFFCDADDELPDNALRYLVSAAEEYNADLVLGGFAIKNVKTQNIGYPYGIDRELKIVSCISDITKIWQENNMLSSCVKLYRTSLIKNSAILFNSDYIVLEDFDFVLSVLERANTIVSIPQYVYYQNSGYSIPSYRARIDYIDDIEYVYNRFIEFLTKKQIDGDRNIYKDIYLVITEDLKKISDDIPMTKKGVLLKKKRVEHILSMDCVTESLKGYTFDRINQQLIDKYGLSRWLIGIAKKTEQVNSDYKIIKNEKGYIFAFLWKIKYMWMYGCADGRKRKGDNGNIHTLQSDSMEQLIEKYRSYGVKIGKDCMIYSPLYDGRDAFLLEIGDNVTISSNVTILMHDNAIIKASKGKFSDILGKVVIGSNCFIGAGSIILPGVYISNGVIIGAGSVVTRSVQEENVVYAGNPARYICTAKEYFDNNSGFSYQLGNMTKEEIHEKVEEGVISLKTR